MAPLQNHPIALTEIWPQLLLDKGIPSPNSGLVPLFSFKREMKIKKQISKNKKEHIRPVSIYRQPA